MAIQHALCHVNASPESTHKVAADPETVTALIIDDLCHNSDGLANRIRIAFGHAALDFAHHCESFVLSKIVCAIVRPVAIHIPHFDPNGRRGWWWWWRRRRRVLRRRRRRW